MIQQKEPVLEISDLSVRFRMYDRGFEQTDLKVVSGLSLTAYRGEVLAVAGSSGSGKSLLASAILGILPRNAALGGQIAYRGEVLTPERQRRLRGGEIALVPQSVAFLDPLMRVGRQADGHRRPAPSETRRRLFKRFGLPEQTERLYPFQLSGGMARRVLVSTALIQGAELVIADEPTPGMSLDQALEALALFRQMADEGRTVLLITHDIDLAVRFADRVTVLYAGTALETAPAAAFRDGEAALAHPYTKALWRALPQNGFEPLPGFQPYAGELPPGCPFAPRCPLKTPECEARLPEMRPVRGGEARCIHAT